MLAADRMQIIVTVSSSASVSELALPIGHWVAVGMWALSIVGLVPANRRQVIFRCIGVGFALHVLILVALFVPRLDDRAAFSATVYLIYARVFCVMAMALSTVWLYSWARADAYGFDRHGHSRGPVTCRLCRAPHRRRSSQRADGGRCPCHRYRDCHHGSLGWHGIAQSRGHDSKVGGGGARVSRRGVPRCARTALALCHSHHERRELPRRRRGRAYLRRTGLVDRVRERDTGFVLR